MQRLASRLFSTTTLPSILALPSSGWSKVHSLRRALTRVREDGKPVAAYAETLDAAGFLLATAATRIWLPEAGNLFLVGLRAESYFFRGLLANLGVRPEVVRAGDYKSAAERFTRDRMSPEGAAGPGPRRNRFSARRTSAGRA